MKISTNSHCTLNGAVFHKIKRALLCISQRTFLLKADTSYIAKELCFQDGDSLEMNMRDRFMYIARDTSGK